jgi:predicted alpha/beta superfamily hydrolase
MYQTESILERRVDVFYPAGQRRIIMRTELDWDRDIDPEDVTGSRDRFSFRLQARRPYVYVKFCLGDGERTAWSVGPNILVLMTTTGTREVYPSFEADVTGSLTDVLAIDASSLGRPHQMRIYLPAGYEENVLRRYPVLYMQDGRNLFFPEEAFLNREWRVDESLTLLDEMNAADKCIVVGVHAAERMEEYTKPGYQQYGESLVRDVKTFVDRTFRTLPECVETGVMGSSLGGVVSFYLAWQYPEVFGFAACLSSTFSHRDDLIDRVLSEQRRNVRFYLDSGWPGDNYEVTLAMAMALMHKGYEYGRDFMHLAFPYAAHDEVAWGDRLPLPVQMFTGKLSAAARGRFV